MRWQAVVSENDLPHIMCHWCAVPLGRVGVGSEQSLSNLIHGLLVILVGEQVPITVHRNLVATHGPRMSEPP